MIQLLNAWNGLDIAPLLELHETAPRRFTCEQFHSNTNGAVYGGQSLALAVAAAERTVAPGLLPHALQLGFLSSGRVDSPLEISVEPVLDGRRFATRLVRITQGERNVAAATLAFHTGEDGMNHQQRSEPTPAPETLLDLAALRDRYHDQLNGLGRRFIGKTRSVELRPIEPQQLLLERSPYAHLRYWMRAARPLPESSSPFAALAYLSDYWFGITALTPHRAQKLENDLYVSSLNHSLWFHDRALRVDDWLLVEAQSPSATDGRGLTFGRIYNRSGKLVASMAQEGLYRQR